MSKVTDRRGTSAKPAKDPLVEAAAHGGLVVLVGGPWEGHWYWHDDYVKYEPEGSGRRQKYARTDRVMVSTLGYGEAVVYEYRG